ncbi:unnamed protein product [Brassicogethes aeneus]|uniref:Glyoxylate reductase/hydroxypyruvate reductase n=1 Tax=Brassicogethes aeneus TaxID=1431903 RepID=A0A9P0BJB3_BRAAE|nr:unnamed protein product [Brassicogethes aeneus]
MMDPKKYNILTLCFLLLSISKFSWAEEKPKILIASTVVPESVLELLKSKCALILIKKESKNHILSKVQGVHGIFWATKTHLDKEIIDTAGPNLTTVCTMSAGYDHIDTKTLKLKGIKFANTPGVLNAAVADTAVLLALAASRRLHEGRVDMESGNWKNGLQTRLGIDISGSIVGIIGFGGIGQAIAKRLAPFEVSQFLYTGHSEKPEAKSLKAKLVDLETLNKEADFIFISCPLNNETKGMINKDFFGKTKKTAVLVNIARGEIVVQKDLIKALKRGKIFAAGLDVMTPEPLPSDSELLKLPNVVLTPHIGSATKKTREQMAELTAHNMLRGLGGENMITPVNL